MSRPRISSPDEFLVLFLVTVTDMVSVIETIDLNYINNSIVIIYLPQTRPTVVRCLFVNIWVYFCML